jgi:phosphoribosylaminoimidazole-succinocarboxamide synthase
MQFDGGTSYDIRIEDYPIKIEGSVKNIRPMTEPTENKMGEAILEFTDDTSVRDYGKLGFKTKNKGASMCATAVYNFQQLEKMGIPTIFKRQIADSAIIVDYVRILDPDKIDLTKIRTNRLFPIEVITRDVVTATSSAARRLREGTLHHMALGLSEMPREFPVFLPKTYVDGSTKLRVTGDEYLPWDQLKKLACATTAEMNTVDTYIRKTTQFAQQRGAQVGFLVFDHKDEYAYNEKGEIILADVPLSLDEITGALTGPFKDLDEFRGKPFKVFQAGVVHDDDAYVNASKQLYRDHYDAKHPEWVKEVKEKLADGIPKNKLPKAPQPPEELVDIVSNIYQAFANEWIGERKFKVPRLSDCVADYKHWAKGYYFKR